MKLVIFDLDQTLIDFMAIHDLATGDVFRHFFNVKARLTEVDFAGRSLIENFVTLVRLKNIPENQVREKSRELLQYYEGSFVRNFPASPESHILPGVKSLLKRLSQTDNIIVLYTGDSAGIVRKVLTDTGLDRYFEFCFYGTEVKTRADMVRLAIKEAEKITGKKFRNKDIVVIGDSVRDIECGKQFNALTIAVATGFHSKEELSELKPDHVFDSLKDYKKVLKAIG
jgi:phosphoglycolate phosphatase-like HAD superfamily hydrolase